MSKADFTTRLTVSQSPQQVFDAINNVKGWWSADIEGPTTRLNASFSYHFENVHRCKLKVIELVAHKRIVWLVEDNYFKFTKNKSEWRGTKIIFEIAPKGTQTEIIFTHKGLVPQYECYEICRNAWTNYIQNSLRLLITTGKGLPNAAGKPQTADEQKLGSAGN